MIDYYFALSVGFLGSLHCLGMCGPLVFAYALYARKPEELVGGAEVHPLRNGLVHHLAFHLGRLITYGLLGGMAAGILQLAAFQPFFKELRNGATLLGGVLMVAIGLFLLRFLPAPAFFGRISLLPFSRLQRLLPSANANHRLGGKMMLGFFSGFLPCGLSWAMMIKAASSGTVGKGFITMILFGAGTLPTLLAAGMLTSVFTVEMRLVGERMAAAAVIFMGLFMVASGTGLSL